MPLSSCCGKPIANVLATVSGTPPIVTFWTPIGVTVITGLMFSDQVSSVLVTPVWVLVS